MGKLSKRKHLSKNRIGHSLGMTFPSDMTEAFNLDNPKTKLKVHPNLEKGKIEIDL